MDDAAGGERGTTAPCSTAKRHLAATAPELNWAMRLAERIARLQDALTGRP